MLLVTRQVHELLGFKVWSCGCKPCATSNRFPPGGQAVSPGQAHSVPQGQGEREEVQGPTGTGPALWLAAVTGSHRPVGSFLPHSVGSMTNLNLRFLFCELRAKNTHSWEFREDGSS